MRGKWRPLPSRADKLGNPDLFAVAWLSLHRAPFLQRTKGRMVAMTVTPAVKNRCAARLSARKTRRRNRRAQSRDDETHEPRDEAILLRRGDVLKRIPSTNDLGQRGSQMAAIASALSRATGTNVEIETIKAVALFCSACPVVFLMFDTSRLDLRPGFF